ncbi:hypothetical protein V6N13_056646 [Hibiscus sabdariffa]
MGTLFFSTPMVATQGPPSRTWCAGVAPEGGPFFPHMVCGVSTRGGLPSAYGVLASRTEGHRVRTWCAIVAPEGAFLPPMVCLPPAPRGIESADGVLE